VNRVRAVVVAVSKAEVLTVRRELEIIDEHTFIERVISNLDLLRGFPIDNT
jgi:hypothetical protein